MPLLNTVTFNVCTDNHKAAAELVEQLKAKRYDAELVDVDAPAGVDVSHAPAALKHNAPADVVVPMMIAVEKAHA